MARKAQPITLSDNDLRSLKTLLRRGTTPARTQTRARVLDLLHRGQHPRLIAETLSVSSATLFNIKRRYQQEGLASALFDKPRSGKPPTIDGAQRAKITALACSDAPPGHARWTLRLLADKAYSTRLCRNYLAQCSQRDSEKNRLQPHLKRLWCIGGITAEYLARMEDLLHLYNLPLDELRPVICFDQLPVQLLGDVVEPLAKKTSLLASTTSMSEAAQPCC